MIDVRTMLGYSLRDFTRFVRTYYPDYSTKCFNWLYTECIELVNKHPYSEEYAMGVYDTFCKSCNATIDVIRAMEEGF